MILDRARARAQSRIIIIIITVAQISVGHLCRASLKTYQCSVLRILMAWPSQQIVLRSNLMDARATCDEAAGTAEESQCSTETFSVFLIVRPFADPASFSSSSIRILTCSLDLFSALFFQCSFYSFI